LPTVEGLCACGQGHPQREPDRKSSHQACSSAVARREALGFLVLAR
jgi:hypothetical protein